MSDQDKAQNHPSSSFPELPRFLRRFEKSPNFVSRHKPRLPIEVRSVDKLRITHKMTGHGIWVYPEFEAKGEWYRFFNGNETKSAYFPAMSTSFGSVGERLENATEEWEDWLEDWIKDNHSTATIEKPKKVRKEKEEKKEKPEKRICSFCGKKRPRLYKDQETHRPICSKCIELSHEQKRQKIAKMDEEFEEDLDHV